MMGSALGGVFTLGVFALIGLSVHRLGHEGHSRTTQALGIAVLFLLICAVGGMLF